MTAWLNGAARMKSIVVRAVVALCVVAIGVWIARPAWADATISVDLTTGLDLTAPPVKDGVGCAEAGSGSTLWTFEVRDTALAEAGELVTVTATFDTPAGQVDISARADAEPPTSGAPAGAPTNGTPTNGTPTSEAPTSGAPTSEAPTPTGAPTDTDADTEAQQETATTPAQQRSAQPGGTVPPTIPVPRSGLDGRRAWLSAPVGWRLVAASAEVTGTAGYLELIGVCPATMTTTAATVTALPAPRAATTTRRPLMLGPTTQPTSEPVPPVAHDAPAAHAALPMTGTDVGGMLALGASLVLAGVLLLVVRRQRLRAASVPDDLDRTIVVTWHD